jgi:hypothetical protein
MSSVIGFVIMIGIVLFVAAFGMWAAQRIAARLDKHPNQIKNARAAAPLSGDSPITHHPSPDGRFDVVTAATEITMTHWVETPALYDLQQNRELLALDSRWSADVITWSPDSRTVTLQLRKYPADVPGVTLTVDLLTGEAQFVSRAGVERVPVDAAEDWLHGYVRRFGV